MGDGERQSQQGASGDGERRAEREKQGTEEESAGEPSPTAPLANEGHEGQDDEWHAEVAVLLADVADEMQRDRPCSAQSAGEQGRGGHNQVGGVDGVAGRRKA